MWSMWNAPSDRDYYDPDGRGEEDDEPEGCVHCGARSDQACEEWCTTNAPASEAASEDANTELLAKFERGPGSSPVVFQVSNLFLL